MRVLPELRGNALVVDAPFPNTIAARDAAEEIRSGLMRGLSIEFVARAQRFVGVLREILRGELRGAGLVDDPSYEGAAVSVRHKGGARRVWL